MPTQTLTKRTIERLPAPHPSGRQTLIWDTELRGFGVLLSGKTNTKTFVVQRDLLDGRTRRMTIGSATALELDGPGGARARARKLLAEFYTGVDPRVERRKAAQKKVTLRTALNDYITSRKDQLRPATAKDYRGSIERHLGDWLDRPLREITAEMIEDTHSAIQAQIQRHRRIQAAKMGREQVQPEHWQSAPGGHTANAVFRVFRILWNFAAERDPDLPANPVRRLRRLWYAEPRRERLIRAEEMPEFYRAVQKLENPIARDFVLVLLFTGLRRAEAAALRWDEIDLVTDVIRLPAIRTKARRRLHLPISSFVRRLLDGRRVIGNDAGWVFPANSRSGHMEEPSSTFDQIATTCGIRVSAHDLRRTYATIAEATDISPMALKALINHSLGSDVTAGYIQITTERLREPAERICQRLIQLCEAQA